MPKTLCTWKRKDFEKKFGKLRAIVSKPVYVCMKCGRVAEKTGYLCCPKLLDSKES